MRYKKLQAALRRAAGSMERTGTRVNNLEVEFEKLKASLTRLENRAWIRDFGDGLHTNVRMEATPKTWEFSSFASEKAFWRSARTKLKK